MKKKIFEPVLITFSLIYTYIAYLILDKVNAGDLTYFTLNPFHPKKSELINSYFISAGITYAIIIKPLFNLINNLELTLSKIKYTYKQTLLEYIRDKLHNRMPKSMSSIWIFFKSNYVSITFKAMTILTSIFIGYFFKLPNKKGLLLLSSSNSMNSKYLLEYINEGFFSLNNFVFNWPYSVAFIIIIYYLNHFLISTKLRR